MINPAFSSPTSHRTNCVSTTKTNLFKLFRKTFILNHMKLCSLLIGIPSSHSHRLIIPDDVLIQFDLLMGTWCSKRVEMKWINKYTKKCIRLVINKNLSNQMLYFELPLWSLLHHRFISGYMITSSSEKQLNSLLCTSELLHYHPHHVLL